MVLGLDGSSVVPSISVGRTLGSATKGLLTPSLTAFTLNLIDTLCFNKALTWYLQSNVEALQNSCE